MCVGIHDPLAIFVDGGAEEFRLTDQNLQLDPKLIQQYREYGREWAKVKSAEQKAKGDLWMEKFLDSYVKFQENWIANASYRVKDE